MIYSIFLNCLKPCNYNSVSNGRGKKIDTLECKVIYLKSIYHAKFKLGILHARTINEMAVTCLYSYNHIFEIV